MWFITSVLSVFVDLLAFAGFFALLAAFVFSVKKIMDKIEGND